MDLPYLMDNASALTTRRLDNAARYHNPTAPAAMKGYFWQEGKNSRFFCKG
jgi:hypothetical protein